LIEKKAGAAPEGTAPARGYGNGFCDVLPLSTETKNGLRATNLDPTA